MHATPGDDSPADITATTSETSRRVPPPGRRRLVVGLGVAGLAAVVVVVTLIVTGVLAPRPGQPEAEPPAAVPSVTPTPEPTLAAVPAALSIEALTALPLAYYDAVIPELLDGGSITPENRWQIATPTAPLVALYASPAADAAPIGALGSTVPTLNTPTATAVWGASEGQDGGMLLVSTPSRNRTPGDGGVAEAASATFAWARAADFTLSAVGQTVVVDNATSVISLVSPDGTIGASEVARLGTETDPTPRGTATYMEANYVDPTIAYTRGNPIALTGAHSSLLPGYGGNSALTALHYYPDPNGSSHGCVRVSAAMTAALAALPVGTPIQFT
ncbi:L,D-transpeptidase [Frigoribacterium sp. 2-23]|uniref:L,D-transpeptidase n=1 Tax=Frigoribacterium sp. 2-23 TaxID=3415006 RepID=UPI003C6F8A61